MHGLPIAGPDLLVALAVVTMGAAIQSVAGFGLAMLAAPLLLLVHPPLVPGPLMASSLVLTALVARRDRAHIDFRGLRFALLGRLIGTVLAAAFLVLATPFLFDVVFAVLVFVAVLLSAAGLRISPGHGPATLAGGLSGLMGTISSIGGPPMALLYQSAGAARLRGTLGSYFLVGTSLSVVALAIVGRYGRDEMLLSVVLVPGMIIGFLAGSPLSRFLPDEGVRPVVLVLSTISAVAVLWRALG